MFQRGESAATGAIAGSLYGIFFGFDNVPVSLYQNLEFRGYLELLGRQLYHIATADRSLCLSADHTQRHETIDVRQIARMFVNKRMWDEINNLINYIAHLEKVKKTSTEKFVWLTNAFATKQDSIKAKAPKTEGKLRPTKFQLLQSRFTKIGFQNKLEKLEPPESKTKLFSEQSNTAADSQSGAVNLPTANKRDTNFTEMHNGRDLMAEQKCETAEIQKVDGGVGKPVTENDITALQPHSTHPECSMVDNFTKMHKTIDLVIQQKCEPTVLKNKDTTLKQSCTENGTTEPCSNPLQATGKQPFLTDELNDSSSESARETGVQMQLDSPNKNKVTLPEPSVQTAAEILYPNTEIQADYQMKNKLPKSTIHNEDQNSGQNMNFAESLNQKLPSHKLITNTSLSISELSPPDTCNIQENNFQTINCNESTRTPPRRDTNEVIDFPHIVTNSGQNNREENPPQTVKESTEEMTKSLTSSPELFSDTSKTQKKTLQKPKHTLSIEIATLPNDKRHEIKQDDEQYKCMLHQSNKLAIDVKNHKAVTKGHSPQTFTKKVEKTISQTKNFKPIVHLSENQSVKETAQNSELTLSKILIFTHNELLGKKDDTQKKYTEELVNTTMHYTDALQEQRLQIQNINTGETANSQIRSLQPFVDSCEKQKLKKTQSSELASLTKIQILPEMESKEEEQEDNQYRNILRQSSDSVNTAVALTVVQEQQPPEALLEIADATNLRTRNPESLTDLYKKQKLKEIPPKLQPVVTTKTEGDYPDICSQPKESVNVAKHYGDEQESFPAVDPNTESAASAWNQCTSPTASCERKSWKYKAYSYADPSVISKSNRRVLMRATDVIQFSSPPPSFDIP
ncbi:uncharacterized protein LOC127571421 [Pristis pectinata]|uniref:uncharacterized protein LOC127571421 n=1 Tax=Pristis pectinata TaxID=685728 RepID=UPI00223CE11D|nr:uncharacterized protein LOC127571421 [Pristis pectinata]